MESNPPSDGRAAPLDGVRVLDLSSIVMGPYASQILGDLGADVVKLEPPSGDMMRAVGPMRHAGMGAIYLHLNRNKRSIALDLKAPEGRAACLDLIGKADVLLYNLRPQAMARLGLDYETVAALNPRLVYVGAYGFGEEGPYAGRPAYDDLIQGMTGIGALYGRSAEGAPRYAPLTLADRVVGLHLAIGVLAGVVQARATGRGQQIEIPMFETMAQMVLGDHLGGRTFEPAQGPAGYARLLVPYRRPYATADGYISVLIYNDKHWAWFFRLIGREDLLGDERYATHTARAENIDAAYRLVSDALSSNTSRYWLEALNGADIPAAPLYGLDDLIGDPHLEAVRAVQTLAHPSEGRIRTPAPAGRYGARPLRVRRPAPRLGEHTREILQEAGLDDALIDDLLARGVAAAAE